MDEASASRDDVVRDLFKEINTDGDNFISKDEMYNHINRYQRKYHLPLERNLKPASKPFDYEPNQEQDIKFQVDELFYDMNSLVT